MADATAQAGTVEAVPAIEVRPHVSASESAFDVVAREVPAAPDDKKEQLQAAFDASSGGLLGRVVKSVKKVAKRVGKRGRSEKEEALRDAKDTYGQAEGDLEQLNQRQLQALLGALNVPATGGAAQLRVRLAAQVSEMEALDDLVGNLELGQVFTRPADADEVTPPGERPAMRAHKRTLGMSSSRKAQLAATTRQQLQADLEGFSGAPAVRLLLQHSTQMLLAQPDDFLAQVALCPPEAQPRYSPVLLFRLLKREGKSGALHDASGSDAVADADAQEEACQVVRWQELHEALRKSIATDVTYARLGYVSPPAKLFFGADGIGRTAKVAGHYDVKKVEGGKKKGKGKKGKDDDDSGDEPRRVDEVIENLQAYATGTYLQGFVRAAEVGNEKEQRTLLAAHVAALREVDEGLAKLVDAGADVELEDHLGYLDLVETQADVRIDGKTVRTPYDVGGSDPPTSFADSQGQHVDLTALHRTMRDHLLAASLNEWAAGARLLRICCYGARSRVFAPRLYAIDVTPGGAFDEAAALALLVAQLPLEQLEAGLSRVEAQQAEAQQAAAQQAAGQQQGAAQAQQAAQQAGAAHRLWLSSLEALREAVPAAALQETLGALQETLERPEMIFTACGHFSAPWIPGIGAKIFELFEGHWRRRAARVGFAEDNSAEAEALRKHARSLASGHAGRAGWTQRRADSRLLEKGMMLKLLEGLW
tara:strand:- start:1934 stop:4054 length:2121 start_codon:yes stop_codon:yes gene_type:complete